MYVIDVYGTRPVFISGPPKAFFYRFFSCSAFVVACVSAHRIEPKIQKRFTMTSARELFTGMRTTKKNQCKMVPTRIPLACCTSDGVEPGIPGEPDENKKPKKNKKHTKKRINTSEICQSKAFHIIFGNKDDSRDSRIHEKRTEQNNNIIEKKERNTDNKAALAVCACLGDLCCSFQSLRSVCVHGLFIIGRPILPIVNINAWFSLHD